MCFVDFEHGDDFWVDWHYYFGQDTHKKFILASIRSKSAKADGVWMILKDSTLRNSFVLLKSEPSNDFTALSPCLIGVIGGNQKFFWIASSEIGFHD
jgi:hypothetical protein